MPQKASNVLSSTSAMSKQQLDGDFDLDASKLDSTIRGLVTVHVNRVSKALVSATTCMCPRFFGTFRDENAEESELSDSSEDE